MITIWTMSKDEILTVLNNKQNQYNMYALIQHESDDDCNHIHYHLYIDLLQCRQHTEIANWFNKSHCDSGKYKESCIQYLTHKNNPEKKQYSFDDIITNDTETIRKYWDMTKDEILDEASKHLPLCKDDKELYTDILDNKLNWEQLILSRKYDLLYLQKRKDIIIYLENMKEKVDKNNLPF